MSECVDSYQPSGLITFFCFVRVFIKNMLFLQPEYYAVAAVQRFCYQRDK